MDKMIMINGLPGNMALQVAEYIIENTEYEIFPFSFTGAATEVMEMKIKGKNIEFIYPDEAEEFLSEINPEDLIIIDYTHPTAVLHNGLIYEKCGIPFVMGTTGGKRDQLIEKIKKSEISAVIAPNMAIPIVAIQTMMEYMSNNFPGILDDFKLNIKESHQKGKADTSGTAKAMVKYFNKLGMEYSVEDINCVREEEQQLSMGIPSENLKGHAYHTYSLSSEKSAMDISISHNVRGRSVYAVGTLKALDFLFEKISSGSKGEVFNMIDVLSKK